LQAIQALTPKAYLTLRGQKDRELSEDFEIQVFFRHPINKPSSLSGGPRLSSPRRQLSCCVERLAQHQLQTVFSRNTAGTAVTRAPARHLEVGDDRQLREELTRGLTDTGLCGRDILLSHG
jgi:hypothetical protein